MTLGRSRGVFTPRRGAPPAERLARFAGSVVGSWWPTRTLTFDAITDREVRGTLHLDVGSDAAGGGTPFFAGPTTSDVTFVARR